jgi:hypothetical protein
MLTGGGQLAKHRAERSVGWLAVAASPTSESGLPSSIRTASTPPRGILTGPMAADNVEIVRAYLGALTYTLREGKIVRAREHIDREQALEAVGLPK